METPQDRIIAYLIKKAKEIEYGEWEVRIIFFEGKIKGLDQLKEPIVKIR